MGSKKAHRPLNQDVLVRRSYSRAAKLGHGLCSRIPISSALATRKLELIHSINPYGLICSFGEGFSKLPGAERYGLTAQIPTIGGDIELRPGMTFSFEPSCMFGKRFINLGGTVVVGEREPLELNRISTRLMHV